jgi:hypothetical protein
LLLFLRCGVSNSPAGCAGADDWEILDLESEGDSDDSDVDSEDGNSEDEGWGSSGTGTSDSSDWFSSEDGAVMRFLLPPPPPRGQGMRPQE